MRAHGYTIKTIPNYTIHTELTCNKDNHTSTVALTNNAKHTTQEKAF